MNETLPEARVYILSKGRPENVDRYKCLDDIGWPVYWLVERREVRAYKMHGAKNVLIQENYLQGLNLIMELGKQGGVPFFKLDDDFKGAAWAELSTKEQKYKSIKSTLPRALKHMLRTLQDNPDVRQVGIPPTANILNYQGKPLSRNKFCINSCVLFRPHDLRYKIDHLLKEDYGMSAAQIKQYGGNIRCESLLMHWQHWTNPGGICEWRTADGQMSAANALVRDFPEWIRHNTKKPGEVIFRWK